MLVNMLFLYRMHNGDKIHADLLVQGCVSASQLRTHCKPKCRNVLFLEANHCVYESYVLCKLV